MLIQPDVSFVALEDRDEMYDSLTNQEEIDVLVDDIFIGIESMKTKDKTQQMSVANFIPHNRAYGVAYGHYVFQEGISDCLSNVIKFRYNDVLKITSNYIKDSKVRWTSGFKLFYNTSGSSLVTDTEPIAIEVT